MRKHTTAALAAITLVTLGSSALSAQAAPAPSGGASAYIVVLKDGAAATYGSDAIGGVVNLVTSAGHGVGAQLAADQRGHAAARSSTGLFWPPLGCSMAQAKRTQLPEEPNVPPIHTLTMNPALDLSAITDRVEPERKLRCESPRRDPGGGGGDGGDGQPTKVHPSVPKSAP